MIIMLLGDDHEESRILIRILNNRTEFSVLLKLAIVYSRNIRKLQEIMSIHLLSSPKAADKAGTPYFNPYFIPYFATLPQLIGSFFTISANFSSDSRNQYTQWLQCC